MPDSPLRERFWELPLEQLNRAEWEALCDGCARCCLKKLQDVDSPEAAPAFFYTRVVCRLLDQQNCRCTRYQDRQRLVPDCLVLNRDNLTDAIAWMPSSCAYKLRYHHQPLPDWHPLLTGSDLAMHDAQIPVTGRVLSEQWVHESGLEEHIIRWVHP